MTNLHSERELDNFLNQFKQMYKKVKNIDFMVTMDNMGELMLYIYKNRKHIPKIPNLMKLVAKLVEYFIDMAELPPKMTHTRYDQFVLDIFEIFVLTVDKIYKKYNVDYTMLIPIVNTVWHET